MDSDYLKQILSFKKKIRIGVFTHKNPDYDAIASSLAIASYITDSTNKEDIEVIPVIENTELLQEIKSDLKVYTVEEAKKIPLCYAIICDVNEKDRIYGLDLINSGEKSADFKNIADVVNKSFEEIEENSRTEDTVTGLASGFPALDNLTTGFHDGEMIIIAARPAVGKTAFVLNIAQKVAVADPKLPVVIFSLEMPDTSLVNRMLAAEGNINSQHMRTGKLESEEWDSLVVATDSLAKTNIYIDDTPGIRVTDIRSKLRRLYKREGQLGLVIIDYLQLIEGTRNEGRQQEVSAISRAIKMMAMEMNVPIIALSQLSRSVEQRQDKRPMLSDIRESGSIEQDADIVAFLYRDDYYEKSNDDGDNQNDPRDEEQQDIGEIEVILEKNRSGARGTARLLFVKSYNKFSNIDYHNEEPGSFN